MEFCDIDNLPSFISKHVEGLEEWEYSDEDCTRATLEFGPANKSRKGRRRSEGRSARAVARKVSNNAGKVSKKMAVSAPVRKQAFIENPVESIPAWSDESEDEPPASTAKDRAAGNAEIEELLRRLDAEVEQQHEGEQVQERSQPGSGSLGSQGDTANGGASVNMNAGEPSEGGLSFVPSQSRMVPAKQNFFQKDIPKLRPLRSPPIRKLSQAYHRPRKRPRMLSNVSQSRNRHLPTTADQLRRMAGLRFNPKQTITAPFFGRGMNSKAGCGAMTPHRDEDEEGIMSNTDDEELMNPSQKQATSQMESSCSKGPPQGPLAALSQQDTCSSPGNPETSERGPCQSLDCMDTMEAVHEGACRAGGKIAGLSAQESFLAKLRAQGGFQKSTWQDRAPVRPSWGKKKSGNGDMAGRLQQILVEDKAQAERFDQASDEQRRGMKHVDLLTIQTTWEGHLINATCRVVNPPADSPEFPDQVTAFINGRNNEVDIAPGVAFTVYEPWTTIQMGIDGRLTLLCTFVSKLTV